MCADHPERSSGRPRKHASTAHRVGAYREAHSLRKITVDVPKRFSQEFRHMARVLRDPRWEPSVSSIKKQDHDIQINLISNRASAIIATNTKKFPDGFGGWKWMIIAQRRRVASGRSSQLHEAMFFVYLFFAYMEEEHTTRRGGYWKAEFSTSHEAAKKWMSIVKSQMREMRIG